MISGLYSAAVFAWSFAPICQWLASSSSAPFGRFAFVAWIVVRICAVLMPYLFKAAGFNSTRTAGSELPPTLTCPTPSICDSFCASTVEAAS